MKLEQADINQIRTAFEKMQSREDLLHVLNEAKPLVYGDKAVPFDLKQLTWYANPKLGKKRYAEFKIKKKSGAERCIHAPVKGLKSLQKTLSFVLQCVYEPHNAAMGFVRNRSIVDNAKLHVGNKYIYNIDLKDFFPSVDQARVWKCLQLKPFNLNSEQEVKISILSSAPNSHTPPPQFKKTAPALNLTKASVSDATLLLKSYEIFTNSQGIEGYLLTFSDGKITKLLKSNVDKNLVRAFEFLTDVEDSPMYKTGEDVLNTLIAEKPKERRLSIFYEKNSTILVTLD